MNMTLVCFAGLEAVYVLNCYGWTNGHACKVAASRTDSLLHAACCEFALHPPHPILILGDINANVADLPTLQNLINEG